jgi:hypothetical protein
MNVVTTIPHIGMPEIIVFNCSRCKQAESHSSAARVDGPSRHGRSSRRCWSSGTSAAHHPNSSRASRRAFHQGLSENGYVEGRNLTINE